MLFNLLGFIKFSVGDVFSAVGARVWAGAVLSLFPVQTLGELGCGRGEVISCSNCKAERRGKGEKWRAAVFPLRTHIVAALFQTRGPLLGNVQFIILSSVENYHGGEL